MTFTPYINSQHSFSLTRFSSSCFPALINSNTIEHLIFTALHTFKQSLIDPNQNLSNWNRGDPCMSNWTGVLCFNMIMDDGYLHVEELLLSGNQLTGSLPEEIGYLPNLDRIQIDENQISGPIPKSFANLNKTKHFHMNNNSISGQIPPELSSLPELVHLLLDNNNLSGYLPPELANMPKLQIVQLDNNHFDGGATIPATYGNMSHLMKLSLRNCSLQGPIPDMSRMLNLSYIDLSSNQLSGSIPQVKLSENITTIDLSNNNLNGTFPGIFSGLPQLQRLALANNSLSGSVPSNIWENRTSNTKRLIVDLQNNMLSNISGSDNLPPNVTVRLQGNPICLNTNPVQFCGSQNENDSNIQSSTNSTGACFVQSCPPPYEYAPSSLVPCFCAVPLIVDYRLKSPGFSDFRPYTNLFEEYLTSGLELKAYQLDIATTPMWEIGPRLRMYLKIFPVYIDNTTHLFDRSEVLRIQGLFTRWEIHDSKIFGPYEVLNFILLDPYKEGLSHKPHLTVFALDFLDIDIISYGLCISVSGGRLSNCFFCSMPPSENMDNQDVYILVLFCPGVVVRIGYEIAEVGMFVHKEEMNMPILSKISFNIDGVKGFTYGEMALATNNFHASTQVGQGGYGNVYKGILADGTVVAIKRAQEGSLQGEKEFLTEIELLSRLHHRNLVSLIGYCDEEGEQMLVYEFMPNGTLRDQLSGKLKAPMSFAMRLKIALAAAKGILYLHMEANPPIFHRDIKASNILLDSKFTAKVADFGLSRLAPIPDIEGTIPVHVSTVVKGTPGYLDPEYFLTRQLTDKSDVYSLGVVFLELLTGMHPISHGKNIVREVNIACRSGIIFSVIDERMGSYPSECVEKFVSLALKCSREETSARPSMAEVVRELESIGLLMHESDSKVTESFIADPAKVVSPPSSSSNMNHPYVSADVSGSDLVSGVMPAITPR
ncbi:hypothetical protein CsSME_00016057 [Camellia sinensis var. sinensis]